MAKRKLSTLGLVVLGACTALSLTACGPKEWSYDDYDIYELDDDYAALYQEWVTNPNPDDYHPYELVNIAFYKYEQEEYHHSEAYGEVDSAGTHQTTHAVYLKEQDELFNEVISTVSSSLLSSVNNALRIYEHADGSAEEHMGTPVKKNKAKDDYGLIAEFEEEANYYTADELVDHLGRSLTRGTNHIISSKTVIDESITTNSDGSYSVYLDLDPIKSVVRYVRQMALCGNLNNYPIFSRMYVDVVLDSNFDIVSAAYHEEYEVKIIGINFNSNGVTTEWFHHNESYEGGIPSDLTTPINYTDWEEY
ncbi:MAG: hypothetical protein LUC31_00530 [Coprobacillus sp.]|nr:hypothetical protein [Coprobacillus sp.]